MSFLVQNAQIVQAFAPVDLNTAAVTGDWINLQNFNHATLIFSSADVAAVITGTFQIATDNAAAGAKDMTAANGGIGITEYYRKDSASDLTGTGVYTRITQADAATVVTISGSENMIVVEIDAHQFDIANSFTHINFSTSDPGAASVGSAIWVLSEARYGQQIVATAID